MTSTLHALQQLPDPSSLKAVEPVLASPTVVDGYVAIPYTSYALEA